MAPVLVATTGCQAGANFDNETIPPGVHRPRLPWAYTYGQFEALLLAYLTVHPEDFVTFGVLQAQPQRGSHCKWGEVAGILAHMAGGRRLLAAAFYSVMRRIQRLARDDPMRADEEDAIVTLVLDKRRRSNVPLGDEAYATLVAPGGPLALASPQRSSIAALDQPRQHHLPTGRRPLNREPPGVAADAALARDMWTSQLRKRWKLLLHRLHKSVETKTWRRTRKIVI